MAKKKEIDIDEGELTREQLNRQDFVDNEITWFIGRLVPGFKNPAAPNEEIVVDHDIELITKVRLALQESGYQIKNVYVNLDPDRLSFVV